MEKQNMIESALQAAQNRLSKQRRMARRLFFGPTKTGNGNIENAPN